MGHISNGLRHKEGGRITWYRTDEGSSVKEDTSLDEINGKWSLNAQFNEEKYVEKEPKL
jgi:hypothetical protein